MDKKDIGKKEGDDSIRIEAAAEYFKKINKALSCWWKKEEPPINT